MSNLRLTRRGRIVLTVALFVVAFIVGVTLDWGAHPTIL